MKQFIESELAIKYKNKGYIPYYNRIDAEVNAQGGCNKCGSPMRYIGLRRREAGWTSSYIAISHCDNCGNEYEF